MGYRNNLYDASEWDLKSSSALTYDAEKVADFIEDLRYVNERYNDKLGMLGTEYDHYRDNQTFVGRAATASKYAIESTQKGYLHEGVYNIEKAIYDKYCSLDDMFKEMVDPSPKARIDTDVIENVKCDYVRQAETSDIVGRVLENSSRYLEQEFGDLGQVTQINYNGVRAIYDEFNGNGGMLDKCVKRMEDYETEALASVDNSQLDYQVSDLQSAITKASGGLGNMKMYNPSMPNNTISLVALNTAGTSINSAANKKLSSFDVDEKIIKLHQKLSAISNRDMPLAQKIKDLFYDDALAIKKVLELDSYIEEASNKYNVDKAMIQAILYREIMCYGLDDPISDMQVRQTYAYEHEKEEYDKWVSSLDPKNYWKQPIKEPPKAPLKYRIDSSTGVGQIFAKTAIPAYNLQNGTNYTIENWKNRELFWNKLQDEKYNVEMVAMVLKYISHERGYNDINNLSDEQRKLVFKAYNGSGDEATAYGVTVQDYYEVFSEYNSN